MKIIVSRINQEWGEDQLEWIKVAPVVGRDPIEILNNPGETNTVFRCLGDWQDATELCSKTVLTHHHPFVFVDNFTGRSYISLVSREDAKFKANAPVAWDSAAAVDGGTLNLCRNSIK